MSRKPRPVYSVEDGCTYPSVTAAARATGVTPASICIALRGNRISAGKHWRYVDQQGVTPYRTTVRDRIGRPVLRGDGVLFPSAAAAARACNANRSQITVAIRDEHRCRGFDWYYADEKL